MKKLILPVLGLCVVLAGCSSSPMSRLKACHTDEKGNNVSCKQEDYDFWKNESKSNTALFQEALKYCKERDDKVDNPMCRYEIFPDSQPVLKYGDNPMKPALIK